MSEASEFEAAWAAVQESEPAESSAAGETPPVDVPPAAGENPSVGATSVDAPPDGTPAAEAPPADSAVDYAALYQQELANRKAADGRAKAEADKNRVLSELIESVKGSSPPASAPAQAPQVPSEAEQKIAKFREEYAPEVVEAIELIAAAKAEALVNTIQGRISPLDNSLQDIQYQMHAAAIMAVHPDVLAINADPAFEAWIASKPEYVRGAYEHVRANGTAQQINAMLSDYKASAPDKSKAPPPARTPAPAVTHRRGGLPVSPNASSQDFDSAWREAPDYLN